MNIASLHLLLHLPESASLKDKRQVVKSVLARARQEFAVAAAEVGSQDCWQVAELGFAAVSDSASHAEEVVQHVLRWISDTRPDVMILESGIETFAPDA